MNDFYDFYFSFFPTEKELLDIISEYFIYQISSLVECRCYNYVSVAMKKSSVGSSEGQSLLSLSISCYPKCSYYYIHININNKNDSPQINFRWVVLCYKWSHFRVYKQQSEFFILCTRIEIQKRCKYRIKMFSVICK